MAEAQMSNALAPKSPNWLTNIRQFWHDVKAEMKRVSWPVRNEVVNTTIIVIVAIFFFAVYLYFADQTFQFTDRRFRVGGQEDIRLVRRL